MYLNVVCSASFSHVFFLYLYPWQPLCVYAYRRNRQWHWNPACGYDYLPVLRILRQGTERDGRHEHTSILDHWHRFLDMRIYTQPSMLFLISSGTSLCKSHVSIKRQKELFLAELYCGCVVTTTRLMVQFHYPGKAESVVSKLMRLWRPVWGRAFCVLWIES